MKKKINKVIAGLKKASKLHAGQATTLKTVLEKKKMRGGGMVKAAKKKMRGGGMVKAAKKKMRGGGMVNTKQLKDMTILEIIQAGALGKLKNSKTGNSTYPESKASEKTVQKRKPKAAKKKMRGGGMVKAAKKKMMRGGVAKKTMRGGGMVKAAKKKMMRGGMAKKKR